MSWRNFFGRKRADADLMEEIESYIAEETAENRARGMSEQEAMRRARIKFGNPSAVRESLWRQNTIPLFDNVVRDLRYALRTLRRTPGFTLIAIGVMALCIGATTSLFTVVRSILLKPLPFRDPDRLVMVYEHFRDPSINAQQFNYNPVAPADFYDWRTQTHGFEDMAVLRYSNATLTGERGELPEQVSARGGSWNLFPMLGVDAAIGRTFTESEDRPDGNAVMLTWSLFERRFGGDRSIVGKQIHLDGKPHTVVGILPSWFNYPDVKVQLWIPYQS
jgi:putative ABC transport system permease protein